MGSYPLPIIDLEVYLEEPASERAKQECEKAADALQQYGAMLVRDPRVTEKDNSHFLDLLEDYYAQPADAKLVDERADVGHQVGVTPTLTEEPKCKRDARCEALIAQMPIESRPHELTGPDLKWRFFWRIGEDPESTRFPHLSSDPVIPSAFKDRWSEVMDSWGTQMHRAVCDVAAMTSVGFGLPASTLPNLAKGGIHVLGPTGSDLETYSKPGTVLAGFHYDLCLLAIHGKARFPGLYIWPRNGNERLLVRVPDGHLLVQAGGQLEWLTGGRVLAGYHEVVVCEETVEAIERARRERPDRPLWRVSSTFFYHTASDTVLRPLEPAFASNSDQYPPTYTGDYMKHELGMVNLF